MTRRTAEWELVGRDSDPVPANRHDVDRVAKTFSDRGTVMSEAASTLHAFADLEGWTGEAAVKFADKSDEAYSDLHKASEKYSSAGRALSIYADEVDTARTDTWKAVQAAQTAEAIRAANAHSLLDGVDDPTDELEEQDKKRDTAHGDAVTALGTARSDLDKAMAALNTAASNCAARINKASEKFKDSKMDNIKGFVAAAVDILNVIAIVILAIIVVILIVATAGGFLGVVLAAGGIISALLTLGTVVGAMILALTVVQWRMGEAGFGEVMLASLGVAGGPLGKIAGKFAGPALARLAPAARTAVTNSTRGSFIFRLNAGGANGMRGVPLLGNRFPLRNLAAGLDAANVNMVDDAVNAFNRSLDTLPQAGGMARVLGTDGLTNTFRQVQLFRSVDGLVIPPDLARNINIALGVEGVASVATMAGQGNDITGFPDSLSNSIDNLSNFSDTINFDAPTRPTTVVPVGR